MKKKKITSPTMSDVANSAGVSQMTVSRVMSQTGYVSAKVRKKVEDAALQIGYVQNRLAHGLRLEKSHLVAVVLPTLANTVFTDALKGITDALTLKGFRPVFGLTEYDLEREHDLVRDLLSWRPFGIVLAGLEHSAHTKQAIKASGVRVAEIMDIDGTPMSVSFGISHINAGKVTAEYMLSKGHQKFAYIGSSGSRDIRAAKRFEGFYKALTEANTFLISKDISSVSSSMAEGLRMTKEVLSRPEKPDAIYYANDDLAAGGMMYCLSNNIQIPNEVALAGFNGLPFLDAFPIQLTTIKTPLYEIGHEAGSFLANDDHNIPKNPSIDIGFTLIKGGTC